MEQWQKKPSVKTLTKIVSVRSWGYGTSSSSSKAGGKHLAKAITGEVRRREVHPFLQEQEDSF